MLFLNEDVPMKEAEITAEGDFSQSSSNNNNNNNNNNLNIFMQDCCFSFKKKTAINAGPVKN